MNKTKAGLADSQQFIRRILKAAKRGMKAWEICAAYSILVGKRMSESAMTARIREMGDIICNLSDYTYSIKKRKKGC